MKPGERVVAERYARAALDVVLDKGGDPKTIEAELANFDEVLAREPRLADVLSSPTIKADQRIAIFDRVLSGQKLTSETRNLLRLLTAKERMGLLGLVRERLHELVLAHNKVQPGEVISAQPLTQDQQQRLAERLGGAIGKTMELSYSTDGDIVGGLVVRLGNRVYDASVVTQLRQFKEKALSSF